MSIFQSAANWIKQIRTPRWLKNLLNLLWPIAQNVFRVMGEEAVTFLRTQIILQESEDVSGTQKLKNVVNAFKKKYTTITISDTMLNIAIHLLLQKLRNDLSP